MTGRILAIATSTLIAGFVALIPAQAQGPMYDRVNVKLPYSVTLGDTTLQPGDYTIREAPSQDKSRVLFIYSQDGTKHEATVMTIAALTNQTPEDTKVVLHHYGPDYYFDKIWITGKNYGYEFPVPANVKERQREREGPVSVAATYQPAPAQTAAAAPPPAQPAPEPQQSAQPEPPAQVQTEPATREQVAQNTPPPAPQAPPANVQDNSRDNNTADREAPANNQTLPSTSADWVMMLLGGGTLSGLGL